VKIKVFILEDSRRVRDFLKKVLEEIDYVEITGESNNGFEALHLIKEISPDVVFTDVKVPGISGVEVAKEIFSLYPNIYIVFATAYLSFTLDAFNVYAYDYMVKPYSVERIRITMERIKQQLSEMKRINTFSCIPDTSKPFPKLVVKEEEKLVFLEPEDILYITREGRKTTILSATTGKVETNEKLCDIQGRLSPNIFYRSHKGFIINLHKVRELVPWGNKTYRVLIGNTKDIVLMTADKVRELEEKTGIRNKHLKKELLVN